MISNGMVIAPQGRVCCPVHQALMLGLPPLNDTQCAVGHYQLTLVK